MTTTRERLSKGVESNMTACITEKHYTNRGTVADSDSMHYDVHWPNLRSE
jgi:hypothetical protein